MAGGPRGICLVCRLGWAFCSLGFVSGGLRREAVVTRHFAMQSADQTVNFAQLRLDGALLIAEVHAFVDAWQLVLAGGAPWTQEQVSLLRERCRGLQRRARGIGQGGLAHHLQSCERCLGSPIPDRDEIGRCLGNVSQIGRQLQQELDRRQAERTPTPAPVQEVEAREPADAPAPEASPADSAPASIHPPASVPRPATIESSSADVDPAPPGKMEDAAPASVEAPKSTLPASSIFAPPPQTTPPAMKAAADESPRSLPAPEANAESVDVHTKAPSAAPLAPTSSAAAAEATRARLSPSVPRPRKPEPSVAKQLVPPPLVLPIPGAAESGADLRASLQAAPEGLGGQGDGLVTIPPAANLELLSQTPRPDPVDLDDAEPVFVLAQVLGMSLGAGAPKPAAQVGHVPASLPSPPPKLGSTSFGSPPIEAPVSLPNALQRDLDARLERIRKAHSYPVQGRLDAMASSGMRGSAEQLARDLRPGAQGMRWWVGPLGVCIVGGLVALGMGFRGVRRSASSPDSAETSGLGSARPALLPSSLRANGSEKITGVLSQVHGYGGAESPELTALLNEEAGMFRKALEEGCAPGSAACGLLARAKQVLAPAPVHRAVTPLGSWLRGLRLPEIGLRDDPRVREFVEFHTENPSGREQFQALLFQCGAYEPLFHRNLLARTLPTDLIAVVMVESGCVPDAESPVGARGLWQFMPATARAYHLRVQSGVLDERLSPTKSTEAALGFLGDLYRKLHSWELALAAYRLGPFGLLAQLGQGDALDYWDLANAGLLPSETAGYVPKIQAFALILANLEHFRFEAAQQRGAERTATLSVPAGTRLGLVARAAGSSGSRIRELNPDIIADTVPGLVGERFSVRVPNDTTSHAHESLARLIASEDHTDECVPLSFDWGRQHFTKIMASRCAEAASIAVSPPRPGRGGSSRVGSGTRARSSLR
jgi:hypothetical protein